MMKKDHKEIRDNSLSSNKNVFDGIKGKSEEHNDSIKFNNLSLDDLIANYVKTPRELNLIAMATSNSWIRCNKLICLRDIIALEILKRYEKQHYLNLCDVADEFEFKKAYSRLNTYNLQFIPVANSWHKGATALSSSFENPCLMVLFINGYENLKKGLEGMFSRTLKASHLEDTSVEVVESLVKAFILDLRQNCGQLFSDPYVNQYQDVSGGLNGKLKFDYFIDNAMILIKGEVKHSEMFDIFFNTLIDNLLDLDFATLTEKLSLTDKDDALKLILTELQFWIGRAICDNDWFKLNKIYRLTDMLKRCHTGNPRKCLIFIYKLFEWLNNSKVFVGPDNYWSCSLLFFNKVKLAISNGDLFHVVACYEILLFCSKYLDRVESELYDHLYDETSYLSLISEVVKIGHEIIEELEYQIENNEFSLKFYQSCAKSFQIPHDCDDFFFHINFNSLNELSNEFDRFLKFYKLDPKKIYEHLINLEEILSLNHEIDLVNDIRAVIEIINRKHQFSSSKNDQESIKGSA